MSTPENQQGPAPWPPMYDVIPTPPPRKRRTGLIVSLSVAGVLVAVAAAAGGVAVAGKGKAPSSTAAAATPVATPSTSAPAAPPPIAAPVLHHGDLRKYLIRAPSSAHSVSDPFGSHNAFTAKQEIEDWEHPAGRGRMLSSYEFRAGAIRQWLQPDIYVGVKLFRFATAGDASGFYSQDTTNYNIIDSSTKHNDASSMPLGEILYSTKKDKYGDERAVGIAVCGDTVTEVWVNKYKTLSLSLVNGLLYRQYKKLCP
jgi:hypothetical protein